MKTSIIKKFVLAACALTLAATTALAEQPDRWVRYVESQGSAWIDTGITGRPNTKIECQVEWMELADAAFVACGDYSANKRFYMCYSLNANGVLNMAQGTNATVKLKNGWETRFEKNRVYNYSATFSATNGAGMSSSTLNVDGISSWSMTNPGINTGRSLYIFASNRKDDAVAGKSKSRCYGLKIYQGDEDGGDMVLVRDFQPCMKGGRAGLYDAVSETIFYSITSTDLTCDPFSEEPDEFIDYVESQGPLAEADGQKPAYIDTGVIGKAGTTVEFKETCLKTISNEYCFLGAIGSDSNSRFYMWYQANGNTLGLGYANTYWRPNINNPDATSSQGAADVYTLSYGDTTHALVSFAAGLQTFSTIDDDNGTTNLVSRKTIATSINTRRNLYVFARNNNGTPNAFCASRLYGLKIWQDNVLVRDFRPCLKNGVAGLYDDVSKRIFYSLGTPLTFNNVSSETVKEKDVLFVEYIEADGNNTLDTGVPARSGIRAKGEMMWLGEDENGTGKVRTWERENYRYLEETAAVFWRQKRAYLGARDLKNADSILHLIHESNTYLMSQYGNSGEMKPKSDGADIAPNVNKKYSFDVTLKDGEQTMKWDDVTVLSTNVTGSVDVGDTLHLFSSSYWRWRSAARCYGLEIYEGDTLVRNFKPCIYKGRGALYDTETKKVYRPSPDIPLSRTGPLVLTGNEMPLNYVDWVETDGTVFIDTGVTGKAGTAADFKEMSTRTQDGEQCLLGSFGNNARCYFWYYAWGYTLGIGYGGTYWRPTKNDPDTVATDSSDLNAYKVNRNDTHHARVSLETGAQTVYLVEDNGNETLLSRKSIDTPMDTGRTLYLFAKNDSSDGTPKDIASTRLYWMTIKQVDSNGSMQVVRDFRPARLRDGTVVLWETKENKPYFPRYAAVPQYFRAFKEVGADGPELGMPFTLIIQ